MRTMGLGLATLAAAGLLLSACGGSANEAASTTVPPAPATVTVTATPIDGTASGSGSTTATSSGIVSAAGTSESTTDVAETSATSPTVDGSAPTSSGPVIVPPPTGTGTRILTLADVFEPGQWTEGSYQPAGAANQIQAMGVSLYCGSEDQTMELRFNGQTSKLVANVAQDFRSPSSDHTLEFSAKADGRQIVTKAIQFKGSAELVVPLSGVAVVQLAAKSTGSACSGSATALITKLSVVP